MDTLFIPAMATGCERAFSSAKKLITQKRNAVADATIEAASLVGPRPNQSLLGAAATSRVNSTYTPFPSPIASAQ
jgi:hypothetical protein